MSQLISYLLPFLLTPPAYAQEQGEVPNPVWKTGSDLYTDGLDAYSRYIQILPNLRNAHVINPSDFSSVMETVDKFRDMGVNLLSHYESALLYQTHLELKRIFPVVPPSLKPQSISIETEETGVNLFLVVRK